MRQISIIIPFLLPLLSAGQAFRLSADFGYQFPLAGTSFFDGHILENELILIYGSHGRGVEFSLDVAYTSETKNGVGIRVSRLFGYTYTATIERMPNQIDPIVTSRSHYWKVCTYYQREFSIKNFRATMGIGPFVGVNMKNEQENYRSNLDKTVFVDSGSTPVGLYSFISLSYPVTQGVELSFLINYYSLSWAPKQREVVIHEVGGINDLSSYSSPLVTYYDDVVPRGSVTHRLKRYYQCNSVGFGIGLSINIF